MQILATPPAPTMQQQRNMSLLNAQIITKRGPDKTPLERILNEDRVAWLARYAKNRFEAYYTSLSGWRKKLRSYMNHAEDHFADRIPEPNRNVGNKSIFEKQNDSLNLVGAFSEFFTAQAQNDLFGASPWFGTKPVGKADKKLADEISAHASWKLAPTNLTPTYSGAVSLVSILGTCFTKKAWVVETDSYMEDVTVLFEKSTKQPVEAANGDFIYADDEITDETQEAQEQPIPEGEEQGAEPVAPTVSGRRFPAKSPETDLTGGEYYYAKFFRPKQEVTYRNVRAYNLHFDDVAFDPTAPELDLNHTDFFHRFQRNLLDVVADYKLDREQAYRLYSQAAATSEATKPEGHRSESAAALIEQDISGNSLPNIPIQLVEGYMRLDVTGQAKVSNVYVVFSPQLEIILKMNYLANVTPKGLLPVHAHTINRLPWRIVGRGFFEKYEKDEILIDDLFNQTLWHDRKSSSPITGLDKSKLESEDEEEDAPFDPDKPVNLKPDAKLEDYIQFKELPDLSERRVSMLNMKVQMVQLRTGITAASQGDMTGLPENNTATGIKQLMGRAAVLTKKNIDNLKRSFTEDMSYTIKLLYSNQDADETFVMGEGENQELASITAQDVRDLDLNVEILLSQAQNQFKLENAETASKLMAQYVQLPEQEKGAQRVLYVQAIRALEFADADSIVRQPVMTIETAIAMLPPEIQQQAIAMMQAGQQNAAQQPPNQQQNVALASTVLSPQ